MKWFLCTLLLSLCATPAMAGDATTLTFEELSGPALQEGGDTTLAQFSGATTILILWRADCPPCRLEMKQLPAIARAHPTVQFALVSLQDATHARATLADAPFPTNLHVLIAQQPASAVFTAMGDRKQLLPFSAAYRNDGTICHTHDGLLAPDRVNQWASSC